MYIQSSLLDSVQRRNLVVVVALTATVCSVVVIAEAVAGSVYDLTEQWSEYSCHSMSAMILMRFLEPCSCMVSQTWLLSNPVER